MDEPDRRTRRVPGVRLAGLAAVLGLLVAVLALPSVDTAFSATRGTLPSSLATDRLQPPAGLTVTQTCTYAPIVLQGSPSSTKVSPLELSPPTGTLQGDVLVAQVAYYGTSTVPPPSGWNRIVLPDTSEGVMTSAVYWKVAVTGEPIASFTRPDTTTGDMVGGIVGYRGVSGSDPIAAVGGWTGSGLTATSPTVSTTATDVVVLHLLTVSGVVQSAAPDGTVVGP